MCAALTVPIIKDGYRLYPGMPVGGRGAPGCHSGQHKPPKGPHSQQSLRGRMSPSESAASASGSPPGNAGVVRGSSSNHTILKPRVRTTSNQSQISARSSFEVAPRPDLVRGRSALSTSQIYMQQRRELAIQQQLRKQEAAKKQQQQQQQQQKQTGGRQHRKSSSPQPPLAQRSDSNGNDSTVTDYDAEDTLNYCDGGGPSSSYRIPRSASAGDHNNNKDSSALNPLRKLLKRLGLTGGGGHNDQHRRTEVVNSFGEAPIEQALPALQCKNMNKADLDVAVSVGQ